MRIALSRSMWGAAGGICLLLLAACGESDTDSGGDAAAGGTNAMTAYVECLQENGIEGAEVPEGGGGFPGGMQSGQPGDRPSGFPSGAPDGFPSGAPSGFPSGAPSGFPSGGPGEAGPGGGRMGGGFADMLRPDGVDDETWAAAQEACQSELPTGGAGGPRGDAGTGADGSDDAAYRNCLAERDVEWAADLDESDPVIAEALEACAPLQPAE
ncbi:hypothetical protein [Micromonospora sp. NBC_01813]|uniref:hypothetical protein n=1 Tax=Micromonospora sp. NBC_01813 TaxID=2975988 RepID=UPI002DDA56B0|nr:hypothetical protein [Micromonospora sp. NBC_01813]WSA07352.1 hypothetical protein OG958_24310 [Micromonospora sp. NBC_01813]